MRKNIVAGNWKMNTTVPEGVQLAKEVCEAVMAAANLKCDVIVGVPFTHLTAVREVIDINKVGLAAQNCADHTSGAYTGEVSAPMVASTGANYVILGHSERRGYYNETAEMLKTKVDLALEKLPDNWTLGQRLEANIMIQKLEGRLCVPTKMIRWEKNSPFILVLDNGRIGKRPLKLGLQTKMATEIIEGLSTDDRLVLFPDDHLPHIGRKAEVRQP